MKRAIVLIAALVFWGGVCRARTITVDDDGPADFNNIQAAIDDANDGDTVIVSPGRYYENINFSGKNITLRSTDPTDEGVVDATIIDGRFLDSVVMFSGTETADSVLSGFTITRGRGHGDGADRRGGAIYGNGTHATIEHNVISGNKALPDIWPSNALGGGVYDCDGVIRHNVISENEVHGSMGDIAGGGLHGCDGLIQRNLIVSNVSPEDGAGLAYCQGTIEHNVISRNHASDYGGGFFRCEGVIRHNVISENYSADGGGGICSNYVELEHNLIVGNVSSKGAGIFMFWALGVNIHQCVFWQNVGGQGGSLYVGNGSPTLSNSILWNNGSDQIYISSGSVAVSYCDIEGGWTGTGNIDTDPWFADPNNGDFHLKSQAGRWDPNSNSWVSDDVTSPCIDAGDPMMPVGAELFPNGGIVNMGAYGGTDEASKSWFGGPVCEIIVAGDINGDCRIDFLDFQIMAWHWTEEH